MDPDEEAEKVAKGVNRTETTKVNVEAAAEPNEISSLNSVKLEMTESAATKGGENVKKNKAEESAAIKGGENGKKKKGFLKNPIPYKKKTKGETNKAASGEKKSGPVGVNVTDPVLGNDTNKTADIKDEAASSVVEKGTVTKRKGPSLKFPTISIVKNTTNDELSIQKNTANAVEAKRIKDEKAVEAKRIKDEKAVEAKRIKDERAAEAKRIKDEKAVEAKRIKGEKDVEAKKLKDEKATRAVAISAIKKQKEKKAKERKAGKKTAIEKAAELEAKIDERVMKPAKANEGVKVDANTEVATTNPQKRSFFSRVKPEPVPAATSKNTQGVTTSLKSINNKKAKTRSMGVFSREKSETQKSKEKEKKINNVKIDIIHKLYMNNAMLLFSNKTKLEIKKEIKKLPDFLENLDNTGSQTTFINGLGSISTKIENYRTNYENEWNNQSVWINKENEIIYNFYNKNYVKKDNDLILLVEKLNKSITGKLKENNKFFTDIETKINIIQKAIVGNLKFKFDRYNPSYERLLSYIRWRYDKVPQKEVGEVYKLYSHYYNEVGLMIQKSELKHKEVNISFLKNNACDNDPRPPAKRGTTLSKTFKETKLDEIKDNNEVFKFVDFKKDIEKYKFPCIYPYKIPPDYIKIIDKNDTNYKEDELSIVASKLYEKLLNEIIKYFEDYFNINSNSQNYDNVMNNMLNLIEQNSPLMTKKEFDKDDSKNKTKKLLNESKKKKLTQSNLQLILKS